METIHKDYKKGLCAYATRIEANNPGIDIRISFKIIGPTGAENCQFYINGKVVIKDTIEEAICFLDGISIALDAIALIP